MITGLFLLAVVFAFIAGWQLRAFYAVFRLRKYDIQQVAENMSQYEKDAHTKVG